MRNIFRSLFFIVFLSFSIITLYAQHTIYIGAKAGISIPDLKAATDNPLSNGYETSLGADFGVLAEFSINKKFSIQTEIDYTQEGGKRDGFQALINPDQVDAPQPYLYATYNSSAKLNYLMIPVMAKFKFPLSKKTEFYINAGGFGSMILSAKTATSGNSKIYMDPQGTQEQWLYPAGTLFPFDDKENIKDSVKRFNAGVILSLGVSYQLGPGKLFVEVGGNYGFITVQKNPDNGSNFAGAVTAHIGYAYQLKRKRIRKTVSSQ